MDRSGCRRLLALIRGLPPESATWRQDKPRWTQEDELLATVAETTDAWSRLLMLAVMRGPVKAPKLPPSLVALEHPDRKVPPAPTREPPPRRARDQHGRVPAQIDVAATRRFLRRVNH